MTKSRVRVRVNDSILSMSKRMDALARGDAMIDDDKILCPKCGHVNKKVVRHHRSRRACRIKHHQEDGIILSRRAKFSGDHLHYWCKRCLGEWSAYPKDAKSNFVQSERHIRSPRFGLNTGPIIFVLIMLAAAAWRISE